jgi:ubiquinone/menaquinone biosynthesis C-methylase UbiE
MIDLSSGNAPALNYVKDNRGIRRIVLPFTRWLRAINAERYIAKGGGRLLDIGCGDGYFLRRSSCRERIGVDRIYGDDISDRLAFDDNSFDYVTMLAVLDLFEKPKAILAEVARILKPDGRLIVTTPKPAAERFIKAYMREYVEDEKHIDAARMAELAQPHLKIAASHTFMFGLNQVTALTANFDAPLRDTGRRTTARFVRAV